VAPPGVNADLAAATVGSAADARPIAPAVTVKATVLKTLRLPVIIVISGASYLLSFGT
jgi:hypothetical protein